ncbi:hypothetical protein PPERSA_07894 [Pseudocohnilembus persalinus]|uniref:Uncharacterized protein n=1 Tax=Pseudocohnilembus persalinus TaxID=266149 RepID=A0A0V0QC66_PSEPJ|nr:hypothetical protein PPERSA_07894 [Pseudocohnilembus persalinus]|eukprot:KRW99817.1 hypothetical protein PPERSA_07894 [Pseudocohnilembus persalinus]
MSTLGELATRVSCKKKSSGKNTIQGCSLHSSTLGPLYTSKECFQNFRVLEFSLKYLILPFFSQLIKIEIGLKRKIKCFLPFGAKWPKVVAGKTNFFKGIEKICTALDLLLGLVILGADACLAWMTRRGILAISKGLSV